MRRRFVICILVEGVARPVLQHHRTLPGAVNRSEKLRFLQTYDVIIVQLPSRLVVYNPSSSEDFETDLTNYDGVRD